MTREPVRTNTGKILGWIETMPNGDQRITDFGGRILGRYDKRENKTTDFGGRPKGQGNLLTMFLNF